MPMGTEGSGLVAGGAPRRNMVRARVRKDCSFLVANPEGGSTIVPEGKELDVTEYDFVTNQRRLELAPERPPPRGSA